MDIWNQVRTLALAAALALAVVSLPSIQPAGACTTTCGITPPTLAGAEQPPSCAAVDRVICGRAPTSAGAELPPSGKPNLQGQVLSTPLDCHPYASDPDVCAVWSITVNVRVTNTGDAPAHGANMPWQFAPASKVDSWLNYTQNIPALAPGQSYNYSWTAYPSQSTPLLPGTCDVLAFWLSPQGGAAVGPPQSPTSETQVCNTAG
jgi:hypothetical protein